tara:strand:- start:459 stop:893 length:435 start_codon:yes stop_codon:yes gene_type:complete
MGEYPFEIGLGHAQDTRILKLKWLCPDVPDGVLKKINKNNILSMLGDTARTRLGQNEVIFGTLRTTGQYLYTVLSCPETLSRNKSDFADLKEKDFFDVVSEIQCLGMLEGIANRRKILNSPHVAKYKAWQIEMIKRRKWELENE